MPPVVNGDMSFVRSTLSRWWRRGCGDCAVCTGRIAWNSSLLQSSRSPARCVLQWTVRTSDVWLPHKANNHQVVAKNIPCCPREVKLIFGGVLDLLVIVDVSFW